jgi:hypothetical protein
LYYAEDDDIGRDTQPQDEDSGDGKARGTAHLAESKSQVLQQSIHEFTFVAPLRAIHKPALKRPQLPEKK